MKKLIIVLLLGLSMFGTVHGESDWIKLYEGEDGKIYFDYSRLDSKKHQGWIEFVHKNGIGVSLYESNCKDKKIRTIHTTMTDSDGNFIGKEESPSNWEYVIPDSNNEKILEVLCW